MALCPAHNLELCGMFDLCRAVEEREQQGVRQVEVRRVQGAEDGIGADTRQRNAVSLGGAQRMPVVGGD